MKELWTNDKPSFQGKYVQFDRLVFDPKPVQKPHIPICGFGRSCPYLLTDWLQLRLDRRRAPPVAIIRPGCCHRCCQAVDTWRAD